MSASFASARINARESGFALTSASLVSRDFMAELQTFSRRSRGNETLIKSETPHVVSYLMLVAHAHAFTFARVSLSARAEACSAIISFGHSLISTCFSTPLLPTTDGTLRQISRISYAPCTSEETGSSDFLFNNTA